VNVVQGYGEEAGAPLVAHPGVQLISFTGETTTGKIIMRTGAETLKRYSFELGGKSPALVFADADLERALDGVVFQIFSLNGERCTANSRLLVERSVYSEFVERVAERARRIRVGDPLDPSSEVGPLIHPPTPFGGMKESGIGREGGEYSFAFYTEEKSVMVPLTDHPIPRFGKEAG